MYSFFTLSQLKCLSICNLPHCVSVSCSAHHVSIHLITLSTAGEELKCEVPQSYSAVHYKVLLYCIV